MSSSLTGGLGWNSEPPTPNSKPQTIALSHPQLGAAYRETILTGLRFRRYSLIELSATILKKRPHYSNLIDMVHSLDCNHKTDLYDKSSGC